MHSYLYDNDVNQDQRKPHHSGQTVSLETLKKLGVLHWTIPVDQHRSWEDSIDQVAVERAYKNRDIITITREGLGDAYESKLKMFFEEHMHEDEEIRYILEGSGFFDVREVDSEEWIRIAVEAGDLIILPAGIYHRFTLDEKNMIKAMRLFKDEPKWTPYNRSKETDINPYRLNYLKHIPANA